VRHCIDGIDTLLLNLSEASKICQQIKRTVGDKSKKIKRVNCAPHSISCRETD